MIAANKELVASIAKVQAEIKALGDKKSPIGVDASDALRGITAVEAALGHPPGPKEITVAVGT